MIGTRIEHRGQRATWLRRIICEHCVTAAIVWKHSDGGRALGEYVGEGDTKNEVSGSADNIVQSADISGGVHFHQHAVEPASASSRRMALRRAAIIAIVSTVVASVGTIGLMISMQHGTGKLNALANDVSIPATTPARTTAPSPQKSPTPSPKPSRSALTALPDPSTAATTAPASRPLTTAPAPPPPSPAGIPPGPVTGVNSASIYPGYTQTVTVRWNPQPDATSFDVHYTTSGSVGHNSVDTIVNTTTTSYNLTVYHGETSCFYIRARNQYGVSAWGTDGDHCFEV